MEPEELIELIETAAARYGAPDTSAFSSRVRHDLAIYRHRVPEEPPHVDAELRPDRERMEYPHPQAPFRIPQKYSNTPEHWLVFSAFTECFLDPIDCASDLLERIGELTEEASLDRMVFPPDDQDHLPTEELEMADLGRIQAERKEMIFLASEIGRGVFGENFNMNDFLETQDTHEQG